jgi:voltage-gated potassium channel
MTQNPHDWIGLGGVDPDDNPRALKWQAQLHWVMVLMALLAVPAYMLDTAEPNSRWHTVASVLDALIFLAFLAELLWMLHLTSHRTRYLLENWLSIVILTGALAAMLGAESGWVAIVRISRVALGGLVLARTLSSFRVLFTRRGAPLLVAAGVVILLVSGAMLYWLEPTITNYWDGLWLAFVTGMTIGYGDVLPTIGASRLFAAFTALVGVALVALFTANIVAYFVGGEEAQARRELQKQMHDLHEEIARLHNEVVQLQRDLALHREESRRNQPASHVPRSD